jgi:hypothetical protein
VLPVLFALVLVLISGEIRYRASIEPFTVVFAAAGVVTVLDRLRPQREAHP